jgi:beta-glucosidase
VVVGPLAKIANLGDKGSSAVTPSAAITPLEGLQAAASPLGVVYVEGPALSAADLSAITAASAVVVVAGLTTDDEGEGLITKGGDRETLSLSAESEKMILDVAAAAPKAIVVLEAGSAIVVRPWIDSVAGLVMAWYPGMEGGAAIASVVFGDASPGGRLPVSFPRAEGDLVPFDHTSTEVTYGFLHGYRWLDANATTPEFPYGFGLGYTTFALSNLTVDEAGADAVVAHVDVTNTGAREGDEIVQAYVAVSGSAIERAPRDLRAFARVHLAPGETKTVDLLVRRADLRMYDVPTGAWIL